LLRPCRYKLTDSYKKHQARMAEMKAARAAANGEDVEGTSSDSDAPNGTPYYSMLRNVSMQQRIATALQRLALP
jgi:hypothetical protein